MNYLVIAFIGIIGLFYQNTFKWLIDSWMNNTYYSHGFLVPIISVYIIWRMRKELLNTARESKGSQSKGSQSKGSQSKGSQRGSQRGSQQGLIVFIIGIVLQGIAVLYVIRFLSGLSLVVTIFGITLYIYGWKLTNKIKFPILFLLLAIPLPFVDIVAPPVQTTSAIASADLANMLGMSVKTDGLLLNTPKGSFEVALECSGLKSVISLLTLSVMYAFFLEGGLLMKSIIVLSSIPLAITGNILRITSILTITDIYGRNIALDYFHDISSILLFAIALIGLFLVGRCFGRLKFKKF